jgi:nicotinate-nucleotide adenylyltransferase
VIRLGLYGGSFDPIHCGHVRPVLKAVEQLELERVLFLPTAQPPHKRAAEFAPVLRRFAMAELAVFDHDVLQVSDFEIGSGPSYTIDTVEHFADQSPGADLHLLIGSDSLAGIETWRRWRELFEVARIAVLYRPGWSREQVLAGVSAEARELINAGVTWVDNQPVDISATKVRQKLRTGGRVPKDWVPEAVVQYARKYSLYS